MRDILLVTPTEDADVDWHVDVCITNGYMAEVAKDLMNSVQRASVATIITKGSVPGQADIGADWAGYISGSENFFNCDAQVRNLINYFTGGLMIDVTKIVSSSGKMTNEMLVPQPVYTRKDDGEISVRIALPTVLMPPSA